MANEVPEKREGNTAESEVPPIWLDKRYGFLEQYRDVIGENVGVQDIVGVGSNAIILPYRADMNFVLKVALSKSGVDNIGVEIRNHSLVIASYRRGCDQGVIKSNIHIPEIIDISGNEQFCIIERIHGETLYSGTVRRVLAKHNITLPSGLTDYEIDKLVTQKHSVYSGEIEREAPLDFEKTLGIKGYDDILGIKYYLDKITNNDIIDALRFIRDDIGLTHNDLHPGNLMQSTKGTHIIDFGKVRKVVLS